MRFTFWNFNDTVDNSSKLNGVGGGPNRFENPLVFAGSLRFMIGDAVKLIDHTCWQNDGEGVGPMWDNVATLVRARMNRRIEHCKAIGMLPRIMILDGVSLYRQLKHRPGDVPHYGASHPGYKLNNGGRIERANAVQLCADYMIKAAKLAIFCFCQPSGGSAVRDGHISCTARDGGYAKQEAE
eukprot:595804-Pyramimonas_sp.AAC.1